MVALASAWRRAMSTANIVEAPMADGSVLGGELHDDWKFGRVCLVGHTAVRIISGAVYTGSASGYKFRFRYSYSYSLLLHRCDFCFCNTSLLVYDVTHIAFEIKVTIASINTLL